MRTLCRCCCCWPPAPLGSRFRGPVVETLDGIGVVLAGQLAVGVVVVVEPVEPVEPVELLGTLNGGARFVIRWLGELCLNMVRRFGSDDLKETLGTGGGETFLVLVA